MPRMLMLAGALLFAGCAARQKSVVVLLPEPAGGAGEVQVTNQAGSQVLARPYQSTEVPAPGKAPRAPEMLDEPAVRRLFGDALAALPAVPVRFELYFESDSTELTAGSRDLLPRILETITQRSPAELAIIGHTDTKGPPDRNYGLGLERAEAVATLLKSLGATPASLEVGSHGDADLLIATGDEVDEPRNRRVEVTVR